MGTDVIDEERACVGQAHIFAATYDARADAPEVKRAKEICRTCPVLVPCLRGALAHDEREGVWGATTGRERSKLKRRLRAMREQKRS